MSWIRLRTDCLLSVVERDETSLCQTQNKRNGVLMDEMKKYRVKERKQRWQQNDEERGGKNEYLPQGAPDRSPVAHHSGLCSIPTQSPLLYVTPLPHPPTEPTHLLQLISLSWVISDTC